MRLVERRDTMFNLLNGHQAFADIVQHIGQQIAIAQSPGDLRGVLAKTHVLCPVAQELLHQRGVPEQSRLRRLVAEISRDGEGFG